MAGGIAGDTDYDSDGVIDHVSYTASTELLVHGASSWSEAGPLPNAMNGLQIVSIDNQIISTG